tara:strand:+ start:3615 stop:4460 length:846 start_codon:yes stop_codon:yes gene_type:complete
LLSKGLFSISILILLLSNSCQLFNSNDESDLLARVGDQQLYLDDLPKFSNFENQEDSAARLQHYIDAWIKEQLLLQKALENLSESQADFSAQLQTYRNSLLIYAYENLLIRQKLDTAVKLDQIKHYYKENTSNFSLKEQLYQLQFVKFINTAPNQDSMRNWLFSENDNKDKLMNYCTQFAINCHLDSSIWWSKSSLNKILPPNNELNIDSQEKQLQFSDTTQTVLMHIFNQKKSGEVAPLTYVKDKITDIILNKRKLELLNTAKQEIFEEATIDKRYERYY